MNKVISSKTIHSSMVLYFISIIVLSIEERGLLFGAHSLSSLSSFTPKQDHVTTMKFCLYIP